MKRDSMQSWIYRFIYSIKAIFMRSNRYRTRFQNLFWPKINHSRHKTADKAQNDSKLQINAVLSRFIALWLFMKLHWV
jgi:hypothetical protein